MKPLFALIKMEAKAQLRSGKFWILVGVFVFLGVLNPVTALITPWIMDAMSEDLAQTGMTVTEVTVTALDSWVQFFKNIPMGLIVFVILQSNIFTREYRSGTLILTLTKGLHRYQVILSKTAALASLWTVGYWVTFLITYGLTAALWDSSLLQNLWFSGLCWWLFGVLTVGLTVFFSVISRSNIAVLGFTGAAAFGVYLIGMLPQITEYTPAMLMATGSLMVGKSAPADFVPAIVITAVLTLGLIAAAFPLFNKKQL